MNQHWLTLKQLTIAYQEQLVVNNCSFSVAKGEILTLLGASGCGKSTILKAIAGLLPLNGGEIWLNEKLIASNTQHTPAQQRGIGMIFQDYALFPHLTVAQNIAFGLRHLSKNAKQQRIKDYLEMVRLENYSKRYPHELSGGQQQRVAIARTLAREPQLLLLDEPFSNLDNDVKNSVIEEMRVLLRTQQMTAIFVTHHRAEAFALADRIAVMNNGGIQQIGSAIELYDQPANTTIANFLGNGTRLRLTKQGTHWQSSLISFLDPLPENLIILEKTPENLEILLRPYQIQLHADNQANAQIIASHFHGDTHAYTIALPEQTITVHSEKRFSVGEKVKIILNIRKA